MARAPACRCSDRAGEAARTARFFTGSELRSGAMAMLPEGAAHHAVHELRLRAGEEVDAVS